MLTCHRPRSTEWCESELTLRAEGLPPDSAMHTATAVAQLPPPVDFHAVAHALMEARAGVAPLIPAARAPRVAILRVFMVVGGGCRCGACRCP